MDATTIAIASLLVTGATAISAALISAWAERARSAQAFHQERLIRDFDELRALLDEAAEQLPHYFNSVAVLESKHTTRGGGAPDTFAAELTGYRELAEQIRRLRARLIIRLGRRNPLFDAFVSAADPIGEAGNEVVAMIYLEEPPTRELADSRPPRRAAWYEAYERFLDAACEMVGSPVEPLAGTSLRR